MKLLWSQNSSEMSESKGNNKNDENNQTQTTQFSAQDSITCVHIIMKHFEHTKTLETFKSEQWTEQKPNFANAVFRYFGEMLNGNDEWNVSFDPTKKNNGWKPIHH